MCSLELSFQHSKYGYNEKRNEKIRRKKQRQTYKHNKTEQMKMDLERTYLQRNWCRDTRLTFKQHIHGKKAIPKIRMNEKSCINISYFYVAFTQSKK